jgi:hypothetical protein
MSSEKVANKDLGLADIVFPVTERSYSLTSPSSSSCSMSRIGLA